MTFAVACSESSNPETPDPGPRQAVIVAGADRLSTPGKALYFYDLNGSASSVSIRYIDGQDTVTVENVEGEKWSVVVEKTTYLWIKVEATVSNGAFLAGYVADTQAGVVDNIKYWP